MEFRQGAHLISKLNICCHEKDTMGFCRHAFDFCWVYS
jgi:hypothetical protein